ncbi:hypothetical protein L581_4236 [Serratia fonticola AU-AP2C]|nr:hypothetical protein L581_4236 [Serratia fonticola AU-AP2C]
MKVVIGRLIDDATKMGLMITQERLGKSNIQYAGGITASQDLMDR